MTVIRPKVVDGLQLTPSQRGPAARPREHFPLRREWIEMRANDAFAARSPWLKQALSRGGDGAAGLGAIFGTAPAPARALGDAPDLDR